MEFNVIALRFLVRFCISTTGFWLVQKCVVVLESPWDANQLPLKTTKTSKYCIKKSKRHLKTLNSIIKVQTVSFDDDDLLCTVNLY